MHKRTNKPARIQPEFNNCNASPHTKILASKLCDHMGLDGAMKVSAENQWHGVLSILKEIKTQRG